MLKIKLNNRGFSKKETMLCLLLVILFIVFSAYLVTNKTSDTTNFSGFRSVAKNFASNMASFRDENARFTEVETIYLYDYITYGSGNNVDNPFDDGSCDIYESYLKTENNTRKFTLKCGEYIIYNQSTTVTPYTIYKVSEWYEDDPDNIGLPITFYNYLESGEEVFSEYLIEKEFLVKYNLKNNTNYTSISSLIASDGTKDGYLTKTYYRTMEEVD